MIHSVFKKTKNFILNSYSFILRHVFLKLGYWSPVGHTLWGIIYDPMPSVTGSCKRNTSQMDAKVSYWDELVAFCRLSPCSFLLLPPPSPCLNGVPAEGRGSALRHSRGRGLMVEPPALHSCDIGKIGNPGNWRRYLAARFPSLAYSRVLANGF